MCHYINNIENITDKIVAVIGLGYVGLPLAVAFAKHFKVIGFDLNNKRIEELSRGEDRTGEVDSICLHDTTAYFTSDPSVLHKASFIIVAVPTPIDEHKNPDLYIIKNASKIVGKNLSKGSIVVYESTVYPGVTEDICVPILEKESGLIYGTDFTVGYSPERINPGDKVHTLETIKKIVSATDNLTLNLLTELYGTVVTAGIYKAETIKIAEAAKVIENTQRDLNIALMNELSIIFNKLGIDTLSVLEAASTKWNFLPFRPGLVGGHCIGVDPYYLTFKSEDVDYHPEVILSGRRINDYMGKYIAETCIKMIIKSGRVVNNARVGILGFTFKENVPDIRNTKVVDMINELNEYGINVLCHDPLVNIKDVYEIYNLNIDSLYDLVCLDALIIAVPHDAYKKDGVLKLKKICKRFLNPDNAILLDVKGCFSLEEIKDTGIAYWRL